MDILEAAEEYIERTSDFKRCVILKHYPIQCLVQDRKCHVMAERFISIHPEIGDRYFQVGYIGATRVIALYGRLNEMKKDLDDVLEIDDLSDGSRGIVITLRSAIGDQETNETCLNTMATTRNNDQSLGQLARIFLERYQLVDAHCANAN